METQKTIIAAHHKPIKIQLINSVDTISLKVNKIISTKYTSLEKPLNLLNQMAALKIVNSAFYANAKINLKVNSTFEIASLNEILEKQTYFMKEMIVENKDKIKNNALEKMKERIERSKYKNYNNTDKSINNLQVIKEDVKSNNLILGVMLIPVFLMILVLIIWYLNN